MLQHACGRGRCRSLRECKLSAHVRAGLASLAARTECLCYTCAECGEVYHCPDHAEWCQTEEARHAEMWRRSWREVRVQEVRVQEVREGADTAAGPTTGPRAGCKRPHSPRPNGGAKRSKTSKRGKRDGKGKEAEEAEDDVVVTAAEAACQRVVAMFGVRRADAHPILKAAVGGTCWVAPGAPTLDVSGVLVLAVPRMLPLDPGFARLPALCAAVRGLAECVDAPFRMLRFKRTGMLGMVLGEIAEDAVPIAGVGRGPASGSSVGAQWGEDLVDMHWRSALWRHRRLACYVPPSRDETPTMRAARHALMARTKRNPPSALAEDTTLVRIWTGFGLLFTADALLEWEPATRDAASRAEFEEQCELAL